MSNKEQQTNPYLRTLQISSLMTTTKKFTK